MGKGYSPTLTSQAKTARRCGFHDDLIKEKNPRHQLPLHDLPACLPSATGGGWPNFWPSWTTASRSAAWIPGVPMGAPRA